MEIKSHIVKLSGRAELPQPLSMGDNWHISLSGSIEKVTDHDNHDGTINKEWTFKPVKVELLDPLGETIVAKDTRSMSKLVRALVYKKYINAASELTFEEYYEKFMYGVMRDMDELLDRYE